MHSTGVRIAIYKSRSFTLQKNIETEIERDIDTVRKIPLTQTSSKSV